MAKLRFICWIVGFLPLAMWSCQESPPAAGAGSKAAGQAPLFNDPDCTIEAWRKALQLGLKYDAESTNQLIELARQERCEEIDSLVGVLGFDTRGSFVARARPAAVRFSALDLSRKPPNANLVKRRIVLELLIDTDGRVVEVEQLEGFKNDWLDELAVETARTWLYRPARDDTGYVERKVAVDVIVPSARDAN